MTLMMPLVMSCSVFVVMRSVRPPYLSTMVPYWVTWFSSARARSLSMSMNSGETWLDTYWYACSRSRYGCISMSRANTSTWSGDLRPSRTDLVWSDRLNCWFAVKSQRLFCFWPM